MPKFTTAYLPDGRYVEVPEGSVRDWRWEVKAETTIEGLASWYAYDPDTGDVHEDVDILGTTSDETRCDHPEGAIYVTNAAQTKGHDRTKPHAAVWVCARRACLLDALAWVERATDDESRFSTDGQKTWHSISLPTD